MRLDEGRQTELEPVAWFVIFDTDCRNRWVRWLCPGRFKHVAAVGYVAGSDSWVVYSVELHRTVIQSIRGGLAFARWLSAVEKRAGVLRVEARPGPSYAQFAGLWCVPAVKHLLGLRCGALWPDQLWRFLVAHGAEVLSDGVLREAGDDARDAGTESPEAGRA